MISYSDALNILQSVPALPPCPVAITDSVGATAAQNISSKVSVPPFANSAMDGFAVRASEIACLGDASIMPVRGSTIAGDKTNSGLSGAWEIMTGAPVPDGYDAVIKIEDCEIISRDEQGRPAEVKLCTKPEAGQNIRLAGEDIKPDDQLLKAGIHVSPAAVAVLAGIGFGQIEIHKKPKISLISTGRELVEDPDQPLEPGQIRNSSAPYLQTWLKQTGFDADYLGIIKDNPDDFLQKLENCFTSDVVISTGAVSAGTHDFIPAALVRAGAKISFHKAAVRPGKPVLYARLANGSHYFGLPGNPVSTAVGLRFFVTPLLRQLAGDPPEKPLTAKLQHNFTKKAGFRFFAKAKASFQDDGSLSVDILEGQESFKTKPMLAMNCWAVFDEEATTANKGDTLEILPIIPDSWSFTEENGD